jgi:hypothetical protein
MMAHEWNEFFDSRIISVDGHEVVTCQEREEQPPLPAELLNTPMLWMYFPVYKELLAGQHTGVVTNELRTVIPSSTTSSFSFGMCDRESKSYVD